MHADLEAGELVISDSTLESLVHNRKVIKAMLAYPQAYDDTRWLEARRTNQDQINRAAAYLELDANHSVCVDNDLHQKIASVIALKLQCSITLSPEKMKQLTRVSGKYSGTLPKREFLMHYNYKTYEASELLSIKGITELKDAGRFKSLDELMYFDSHLELLPKQIKEQPSVISAKSVKRRRISVDYTTLLNKCPFNYQSPHITEAIRAKITEIIDAPPMPLPDICINHATLADSSRAWCLLHAAVGSEPLSATKFYAVRFHLFMLWAKKWDLVPLTRFALERREVWKLVSLAEHASIYECLYKGVKLLEDRHQQYLVRLTRNDWKLGDHAIFGPIHPLPHLLKTWDDEAHAALELWKVVDFHVDYSTSTNRGQTSMTNLRRVAIEKMCELYLTDWTPYILSHSDYASTEFGRHADGHHGGYWRFSVRGLCQRWLNLPREINVLAHSMLEPPRSISTFWDGETDDAYSTWKEGMDGKSVLFGDTKARYADKCGTAYRFDLDNPPQIGEKLGKSKEAASPRITTFLDSTEVDSASVTEIVEVEDRDPTPSPMSDNSEDVDMLVSPPDTTSSQTHTPALEENDDSNPRGQSDELGNHDAPTTGGTPQMQFVEDMTVSTNNGEPLSEVGDIHDQPVKGMRWRRVIPWGRWDGLGDDIVEGWI